MTKSNLTRRNLSVHAVNFYKFFNLFESNHPNSCGGNFELINMISFDQHPELPSINSKKSAIFSNINYGSYL